MDPNKTYRLWSDAILANEIEQARIAAEDLAEWLLKGGFEPQDWQLEDIGQDMRDTFWEWWDEVSGSKP